MGFISQFNHVWISCLTLNHSDGSKLDGLLADASVMARVHHIRYVFVGLWGLRSTETYPRHIYTTTPCV